jgi:hypothetical protein
MQPPDRRTSQDDEPPGPVEWIRHHRPATAAMLVGWLLIAVVHVIRVWVAGWSPLDLAAFVTTGIAVVLLATGLIVSWRGRGRE